MTWNTLDDMDMNGKNVLIRVDVNVPCENGKVLDATRLDLSLIHISEPTRPY